MKYVRRLLALLVLAAMVVAFVAPGMAVAKWCGWLARVQLVPAIFAGSAIVLLALAISVALFGRLYCSVICPLGISQDVVRGVAKLCRIPARPLRGGKVLTVVRVAILVVFAAMVLVGFAALIEPYGIFGRFFSTGIMQFGEPATTVVAWSIGLFALIVLTAAFLPRAWCNAICPVGTFLGFFSRFALFRIRINESKCKRCGLCVKSCEKGALSVREDRSIAVDHSRCVMCGDCKCGHGALKF